MTGKWTIEQDDIGNDLLCLDGICVTVLPDDETERLNCIIDAALEVCVPAIFEAAQLDGGSL